MARVSYQETAYYNPGMGIYQFASVLPGDPATEDIGQENSYSIENPYVAGTVIYCSWKEIEPQEHVFRWDKIDSLMSPWTSHGKRCILRVCSCRREIATPEWVFNAGARYVPQRGMTAHRNPDLSYENRIPVYWDDVFLEKYDNMIRELAKRYDQDPNIEAVQIALGKWGESFLGSEIDLGPVKNTLDLWQREGYSIPLAIETFKRIMEMYKQHFKHTPLIAMIGGPFVSDTGSTGSIANTEEISTFCIDNGIWLQQNGYGPKYNNYLNVSQIFRRYYRKVKVMYEIGSADAGKADVISKTVENMLDEHVSYAFFYTKNLNHPDEKADVALNHLHHRIGYQLRIKGIHLPQEALRECSLALIWENVGCAPVYSELRFTVLALDRSMEKVAEIPAKVIPRTELWTENQQIFSRLNFQFPPHLPSGEYNLHLLINEPRKGHPVFIANEELLLPGTPEIDLGKVKLIA